MEKKEFETKFKEASTEFNMEDAISVLKDNIDPDPINMAGTRNIIIVIEELAELQQQLLLADDHRKNFMGLIEEIADVTLALNYITFIFHDVNCELSILNHYDLRTTVYFKSSSSILLNALQQELSKQLRGKGTYSTLMNLVMLTRDFLNKLVVKHGITEETLNKALNVKIDRLRNTEGIYK